MSSPYKYQSSWLTEDLYTKTEVNTLVSTSYGVIPQYASDPASPLAETAWVLRTPGVGGTTTGVPMGLLLALTYAETAAGGAAAYQLSYRTEEGTTLRTTLS